MRQTTGRRVRTSFLVGLAICAAGLSGCAGAFDPYQRPGNWTQTGAANENLARQTANPSDLIRGHGEALSNGVAATAAIDKGLGANGAGTASGLQTAATPVAMATQ
jgi:type IV pilus biogenesis protein CpaD/CtpE